MPPDHSTLSRTRRLIDVETHQAVFRGAGVAGGKESTERKDDRHRCHDTGGKRSVALDCAADTGEGYQEFLTRLAQESGIATPTREPLAKLDRKRTGKGSNEDWVNPHDPDARITKMKDGRTHLAHKAEHAVDLETGAVIAVTVAAGDAGDSATILETLPQAGKHIAEVASTTNNEEEANECIWKVRWRAVGDKGYPSNDTLQAPEDVEVRTYISEPDRGRRCWKDKPEARQAV
jgi:transposase